MKYMIKKEKMKWGNIIKESKVYYRWDPKGRVKLYVVGS